MRMEVRWTLPVLASIFVLGVIGFSEDAFSQTTIGPTPYLSFSGSPFDGIDFSSGYFHLEDVEDGLFDAPGATSDHGCLPGFNCFFVHNDSVDEDDGVIDGFGKGVSMWGAFPVSTLTYTFDENILGNLPTHAGIVWTDGLGTVTFEAFDKDGLLIWSDSSHTAFNDGYTGQTGEDRFYGVIHEDGISKITINAPGGDVEADHLQYGFVSSNQPPIADAGPDQSDKIVGDTVTLDGSGSSDPDSDPLTYQWNIITQPVGSTATLTNPTSVSPTFVADFAGQYDVELVVNDGTEDSGPDTVTILALCPSPLSALSIFIPWAFADGCNVPPIADFFPSDDDVVTKSKVKLNGLLSRDPDGDDSKLLYDWILVTKPAGSKANLKSPNLPQTSFTPDVSGVYVIKLDVIDELGAKSEESKFATFTAYSECTVTAKLSFVSYSGSDIGMEWEFEWGFRGNLGTHSTTLANGKNISFSPTLDVVEVIKLKKDTIVQIDTVTKATEIDDGPDDRQRSLNSFGRECEGAITHQPTLLLSEFPTLGVAEINMVIFYEFDLGPN